jgi:hypothetical protein
MISVTVCGEVASKAVTKLLGALAQTLAIGVWLGVVLRLGHAHTLRPA